MDKATTIMSPAPENYEKRNISFGSVRTEVLQRNTREERMLERLPTPCVNTDSMSRVLCVYCWTLEITMEVLGGEFCDMTPQELAAPVNTVAVSLEEIKTESFTPRVQRS